MMPTCFPKCLDEMVLVLEEYEIICLSISFPTLKTVGLFNFCQNLWCKLRFDLHLLAFYIFLYHGTP